MSGSLAMWRSAQFLIVRCCSLNDHLGKGQLFLFYVSFVICANTRYFRSSDQPKQNFVVLRAVLKIRISSGNSQRAVAALYG